MTSARLNGEVEFRFYRAGASGVSVVGDFPGWDESGKEMAHEGNGWWVLKLRIEAGEYTFRYRADGAYFTDFAASGVQFHKNQWKSILNVGKLVKVGLDQEAQWQAHDEPLRIAA